MKQRTRAFQNMTIEPQPPSAISSDFSPAPDAAPARPTLLAPVWHTVVIVVILLGNSFFTARLLSGALEHGAVHSSHRARLLQYGSTIVLEFFLLLLVWLGIRINKVKLRELIGGRWNRPEEILIDVAIASLYWIVSSLILAGLGYLLGLSNSSQVNDMKQRLGPIMPQFGSEMVVWVALCCVAGFVEEIIFRGYLQRQIGAITKNIYVGLVISGIIFGAGHGYQGTRRMLLIALYGMMFGLVALWRKSLRPGMIAHAWQDVFAVISYRLLEKFGRLHML